MSSQTAFVPKTRYPLIPELDPNAAAALADFLKTNPPLSCGATVREFEAAFAKRVGAAHAVAVSSGSSAAFLAWFLPLAIEWIYKVPEGGSSIKENRRVIVPATAQPTAIMPALQLGYEPYLCETDPETWGLDLKDLRRLCEKDRPSIVLVDHVLGVPANLAELRKIRDEFEFILLEDCRDGLATAALPEAAIGHVRDGEISFFSGRASSAIPTIEGGILTTSTIEGASVLRMLRSHGSLADVEETVRADVLKERKIDAFLERASYFVPGFNARPTEISAVLGLYALERLSTTAAHLRANHAAYFSRFGGAKNFSVQKAADAGPVASPAFGVLASSPAHRKKVVEVLDAKGIETSPLWGTNHARQPYWLASFGISKRSRPVADRIADCGFVLPNHVGIETSDVGYIADTVLAVTP